MQLSDTTQGLRNLVKQALLNINRIYIEAQFTSTELIDRLKRIHLEV